MKIHWGLVQALCSGGLLAVVKVSLEIDGAGPAPRGGTTRLLQAMAGLACVLGMAAAGVMRRRAAATAPAVDPAEPRPEEDWAISATYCNTAREARRCEMYTLANRTVHFGFFAFLALVMAAYAAGLVSRVSVAAALVAFPVLHVASFLAWFAYVALLTFGLIRARFPRPDSVRLCTTSLTRRGFRDVTPDKVIVYSWDQIRQIREAGGDIHIWTTASGCYIPRSGFESLDVARRYHRAAVTLWKSRGRIWPDERGGGGDPDESPLGGDDDGDRAPYAKVIRWACTILVVDYLAILAFALTR